MDFKNKNVAILGWGINGLDAAKYLLSQNAKVTILDAKNKEELDFGNVDLSKTDLVLGPEYLKNLKGYDLIFRTPGIYRFSPELVDAEKNGTLVTSTMQLFFDLCPAKIIGVTGTKGKGTTSTLIYQILKNENRDVYLAGNIGYPMLELLPKLNNKNWIVLEMSSFQLIDLTKSPHIAVVLNITSDHMDWHKDREEYIKAKRRIVRYQSEKDYSVINYDYEESKKFAEFTKAKIYYFSKIEKVSGSYVSNSKIYLNVKSDHYICDKKDLILRGEHNLENITAAACASSLAGASLSAISKTIKNFKGLEHRLEFVREIKGISFYNDSFSTNPQTTLAAVHSFNEPMTLILGGFDKKFVYDELFEQIANSKNVLNILLIGDIAPNMLGSISKFNFKGYVEDLGKPSMTALMKKCLERTPAGGVVVLSPATSSFDMFNNYKERGLKFKEAVNNL
jgi:UDP-N-acetylmuramoylalanine--D-glutamate ligase